MYKPHLNIHIRKNHDSNSNKLKDKAKNNKISSFKKPSVVDDIDKPFKCRYCPKRFNDQFRLTIHTRIHTGESKLGIFTLDYSCNIEMAIVTLQGRISVQKLIVG